MTLGEQVLEFEKEISDEGLIHEEKENILKLTTLEEVKEYYLYDRGWKDDDDFIDTLLNLIIRLKE
jgi:hypothetical protein